MDDVSPLSFSRGMNPSVQRRPPYDDAKAGLAGGGQIFELDRTVVPIDDAPYDR
jgi:hypothetical protein